MAAFTTLPASQPSLNMPGVGRVLDHLAAMLGHERLFENRAQLLPAIVEEVLPFRSLVTIAVPILVPATPATSAVCFVANCNSSGIAFLPEFLPP